MEEVVSGSVGLPSNLDQDGLHGELTLPLAQAGELGKIDLHRCVSASVSFVSFRARYTLPFLWSTQGRLTFEMKVTSGGTSG